MGSCLNKDRKYVRSCEKCEYLTQCYELKCGHFMCINCYNSLIKRNYTKCVVPYCTERIEKNYTYEEQ